MFKTEKQLLTVQEFRNRYAGDTPHYEYWFGEAVPKALGRTGSAEDGFRLNCRCDFALQRGLTGGTATPEQHA